MKRRLTLRSEHLAELTSDELTGVAGASVAYLTIHRPCPTVQECIYIAPVLTLQRECPTERCFTGTTLYTVACA